MAQDIPSGAPPSRDGETEDMVPVRGVQSPPTIHRANRRPLGVGPASWLGGVLLVALVVALVLLFTGAWPVAAVLIACALIALALLLVAVEREPDDPAARLAVAAADRAVSHTRLLRVAAGAWSRAGLALVRINQRRYRLRWQLRRQLQPLGEAAYRGEDDRVQRLRAEAQQLERQLHDAQREGSHALGAARAAVERERVPLQATQAFPRVSEAGQAGQPPNSSARRRFRKRRSGSETASPSARS
jgi:hypothetical protein